MQSSSPERTNRGGAGPASAPPDAAAQPATSPSPDTNPPSAPPTPGTEASASADTRHERVVLDPDAVQRAATRIAHEIAERNKQLDRVVVVAIASGGIPIARLIIERLCELSRHPFELGELDVTLYRDDVIGRGKRPVPHRTRMPPSVTGKRVVLVDDVMFTGRTVRAAMDAVIDFGRPEAIQVACLVDRGHRELPIQVDFVGKNIPTQRTEQVSVVETESGRFEVRVV